MRMCGKILALALGALCGAALSNQAVCAAEADPAAAAMAAEYKLEPLSKEDADYTVNLGYYNCDHMTAACIGQDSGIFKALGLKVEITGNGKVPEAMSAGRMDMAYAGWTTTLGAVQNGTPLFIAA